MGGLCLPSALKTTLFEEPARRFDVKLITPLLPVTGSAPLVFKKLPQPITFACTTWGLPFKLTASQVE